MQSKHDLLLLDVKQMIVHHFS